MAVAQDREYLELKNNFASIRVKMIELQIKNEEAYRKYQDELRRRPKILNTVCSTLEISKQLVDSYYGLAGTSYICRRTKYVLTSALRESSRWMQDLTQMQLRIEKREKLIDALEDKVRVGDEQRAELLQQISAEESKGQQAKAEVRELQEKLEAALREKKHVANRVMERTQRLYLSDFVIENESNTQNVRTTRAAAKRKQWKRANETARKKMLEKVLTEISLLNDVSDDVSP